MNHYEIHVSVRTDDIEGFKKVCTTMAAKAIVIDLQSKKGESLFQDVMTSTKHTGWYADTVHLMKAQALTLTINGFDVVRQKIEESPDNDPLGKPLYLESHIRVKCHPDRVAQLRLLAAGRIGLHVSRNVFKKCDDGDVYMMLTYRDLGISPMSFFKAALASHQQALSDEGFVYDKIEVESVIYDSNQVHDESWIKADL